MARAAVWYQGNDMRVRLDALQSSTMASGVYLNNSTAVSMDVWKDDSTASTGNRVITNQNLPYVAGTDGRYDAIAHSTDHSMAKGTVGMVVVTVDHVGLDASFRPKFRVDYRRTA